MTRTTHTKIALTPAEYNLEDSSDYETMSTGASNGLEIAFTQGMVIYLKNPTGGDAIYTIKTVQPTAYSNQSIVIPDDTVTVATTKIWVFRPTAIYRQTDLNVYIDCDVAGELLVFAPA